MRYIDAHNQLDRILDSLIDATNGGVDWTPDTFDGTLHTYSTKSTSYVMNDRNPEHPSLRILDSAGFEIIEVTSEDTPLVKRLLDAIESDRLAKKTALLDRAISELETERPPPF